MVTREDILNAQFGAYLLKPDDAYRGLDSVQSAIQKAMDVYSKEMAIGFVKYIEENKFVWRSTHEKWEKWTQEGYSTKVLHEFTREQLYQSYLNTLTP